MKILQMNDDGISVLVKWGTSLKKENVFINNCRKFDVEKTYLRKRKATDFFAPMSAEEYLRKRKATDFFAPMAAEKKLFTNQSLMLDLFAQMVK